MIALRPQAAAAVNLLSPGSAANTAAATGGWVDVRNYVGDLTFTQNSGAITGTLLGVIQDADDISGTNAATIVPVEGAFVSVSAANQLQKRTIEAGSTRGFIRYLGTVGTGPVVASVVMLGQLKY